MEKRDLKSYTYEELEEYILSIGEKKFRAGQVYQWIHEKLVEDFSEMKNLSVAFRERLAEECELKTLHPVQILTSQIDGTQKYLFELPDGNIIESVLMKYHHGNSVCISTQVGCRMGCRFCASTLDGLLRNLTPSEMLDEIYRIQAISGERVSNIVLMGTGEPLDNFDNVMRFLQLITHEKGLNISQRNITISSCGIVENIRKMADMGLQVTLALSLHASEDEVRKGLMPIAYKYTIAEVLDACDYYFEKTGRRISFEYSLVAGVNDTLEEAGKLVDLVKGKNCHVNLIPVNPIKERDYKQSDQQAIMKFKNKLEKNRINVTIRREMGRDIQGACGQLRRSYVEKEKEVES